MKSLILFDQDLRHYRQPIYRSFSQEFRKLGYELFVVYDLKRNEVENDGFFIGIRYSFSGFVKMLKKYDSKLIIQFVWLKYRFLFPFMLYCKIKRIRSIVWSHGIGLKNLKNPIVRNLHFLRHKLATALIIYSPNERKYVRASHRKLFIANNTLDFSSFPEISRSREELKKENGYEGKKIILSVGRFHALKRRIGHLVQAFNELDRKDTVLLIVGPGVSAVDKDAMNRNKDIHYLGEIYDPVKMNEIYKMSDLFAMPGGIGLAINQAFYHGLPIVLEDTEHSPEVYYLRNGKNGFLYERNNIHDLQEKLETLLGNDGLRESFSREAKAVIMSEGSIDNMIAGFTEAIKYAERK